MRASIKSHKGPDQALCLLPDSKPFVHKVHTSAYKPEPQNLSRRMRMDRSWPRYAAGISTVAVPNTRVSSFAFLMLRSRTTWDVSSSMSVTTAVTT
jgi:hypothetical protein